MTPLKAKFLRDLTVRGFSPRTLQSYTTSVEDLARHYNRSPSDISYEEVVDWVHHLITDDKLAASSVNIASCAVRFLYGTTLGRDVEELVKAIPRMKRKKPAAEAYACSEVESILLATPQPRDRALLSIVYGCGLRLTEAMELKGTDIDRARMQLRVRNGKGGKERVLPLSASALETLESYWREQRSGKPGNKSAWLFLGRKPDQPLTRSSAQGIYYRAVKKAKIRRKGGIHVLRHSFATHCLENEVPIHLVQRYLGHTSLATTARYLHVTSVRRGPLGTALNLIEVGRTATGQSN